MKFESKLKILFVEDQIPDTELAIKHLEKNGIYLLPKRVRTKDELVDALQNFQPDLVLTDYFHPVLDGKTTLSLTKKFDPNIPVIIFSGTINEQIVTDCMKYGANDFVLKNSLDRLPRAVNEVINRKRTYQEKTTADHVLRESIETFQQLFEVSTDPILFIEDSSFIDCNPAAVSILGYKSKFDIIGKKPWEISPEFQPDGRSSVSSAAENIQCSKEKGHHKFEWLHLKANGDELPVEVMLTPVILNGKQLYYVIWRDITERKKAEKALIKSEKKYRTQASLLKLYYDLPFIGMAIASPESKKWVQVNDRLCEIFGYTKDELLEKSWAEITHPDDLELDVAEFDKVMNGQTDGYAMDKRFIRQDGKIIHASIDVKCVRRSDGSIDFFVATVQDITERKLSEEQVKLSHQQLRQVIDLVPHFVFAKDIDGKFILVNQAIAEAYGTTIENLIGKSDADFAKNKKEAENFRNDDLEVIKSGKQKIIPEENITDAAGNIRTLQTLKIPFTFSGSTTPAVLGVAVDITERKKAEAALKDNEEKFRAVVQNAEAILFVLDENGIFILSEGLALNKLGLKPRQVIGMSAFEIYKDFPTIHESINKAMKGEITRIINVIGDTYFDTVYSPFINAEGKLSGVLGLAIDVTERVNAETELIRAKEKAELSNRLKDAFIANISHEIRTPLNGILGMKSLIQEAFSKYASKDEEFYFNSIDRSSRRLMRTVDMILNFSRIQAGDFPITPKPLNLPIIITNLISEFKVIAQAKSIELSFDDELKGLRIIADEYTVTQIISNLIDNAIKYTKIGFVKVVLYQNHENQVMIDIIDSGIGILEDYKQNLFKPYSQEEFGYSRSYEGIGLGLSIVQKFVEMNKAKITVESKKGEGSKFTVQFVDGSVEKPKRDTRKELNSETKITHTKTKSKDKPALLVVEDDLTSQELIKTILKKYYEIVIVTSAQEAIDALKEGHFEIILMDISIPGGVNGLELTKILRKTEEFSDIPIIAVTAHAFPSDHQRSLEAGCNEYISKPFESKELLEKVRELIED